jgi:FkbM family methyltransferase
MVNLIKCLSRLPNYIRRFGLLNGLCMAVRIEQKLPRASAVSDQIMVSNLKFPVHLRRTVADHATFWQCIVQDQYRFQDFPQSERLFADYQSAIDRGERPLVIDCGANIGLATLWFAHALPLAKIVAIEPDQDNLDILSKNLTPFGERITVLRGAIWSRPGHVRIENPEAGSASFRVTNCHETAPGAVRTYTIPEICRQMGAERPFVVKMDIEGAQGEVFSQANEWVGETSMLVLELDDWQLPWSGSSRSFFSCISQWPFDYLLGGESIFCFRDFKSAAPTAANKEIASRPVFDS